LARLSEDEDEYKIIPAEGCLAGDASYWWSPIPDHQRQTLYEEFEQLLNAQLYPADAKTRAKQQASTGGATNDGRFLLGILQQVHGARLILTSNNHQEQSQ